MIAEIAAASRGQSSDTEQVNTAATESMKAQSAALLQLVSRFRLSGEGPQAEPAPAEAPPRSSGSYISAPQLPPVLDGMLSAPAVAQRSGGARPAF